MKNNITPVEMNIKASVSKMWDALTLPQIIKQ